MDRKTRELCCGTDGAVICGNQPTWQVKNETGGETRVCDLHLAWAMRKSGLPCDRDWETKLTSFSIHTN